LERPARHRFSFTTIGLFLHLVLRAATGIRTAASVLRLLPKALPPLLEVMPDLAAAPSAQTGRLWLLRVGLYELRRPKEKASDWVWLVDHTIQLGVVKVLLVVGLRLGAWQARESRVLCHRDLQVILLEPIAKSNGTVVAGQLREAARITGVPRMIISDQCRELGKGVEQFLQDYPDSAHLHDIKHKTALLLEHQLEADSRWREFLSQVSQARRKMQQTPWAFLVPPAQKEKARYMNFGELVRWAVQVRRYLEHPVLPVGVTADRTRLEAALGWLREYDPALAEWEATIEVIVGALEYVRQEGYHAGAEAALQMALAPLAVQAPAEQMAEQIVQFVSEQSALAHAQERLLGTSEVLESLIGTGKRLEGHQSKRGFTALILGMAAMVADPTKEYLQQALETIHTNDVRAWGKEHLGVSLQAMRRQTLGRIPGGTKLA
jgi:hypothetical protein